MTILDAYWADYDRCLDAVAKGVDVDGLIATCNEFFAKSAGDAFFPNGADRDLLGTLTESGWSVAWMDASYFFVATDAAGQPITFVEGDIYRGDNRPRRSTEGAT